MSSEAPAKALSMVLLVALFCSVLVTVATIAMRPLQERNALILKSGHIAALSGLFPAAAKLSRAQILEATEMLDPRVVDLSTGEFVPTMDARAFDMRAAAVDPTLSEVIAPEADAARLGRRSRFALVHLVWDSTGLQRVILPIYGQGMWSTLYGYLALERDLTTIAALSFYEQTETAGLGDQVTRPDWQAMWRGKQLYGRVGDVRFHVARGVVSDDDPAAAFKVDGLTGATVTGQAVTALVRYWFGADGYGRFLQRLAVSPPQREGESDA